MAERFSPKEKQILKRISKNPELVREFVRNYMKLLKKLGFSNKKIIDIMALNDSEKHVKKFADIDVIEKISKKIPVAVEKAMKKIIEEKIPDDKIKNDVYKKLRQYEKEFEKLFKKVYMLERKYPKYYSVELDRGNLYLLLLGLVGLSVALRNLYDLYGTLNPKVVIKNILDDLKKYPQRAFIAIFLVVLIVIFGYLVFENLKKRLKPVIKIRGY